MHASAHSRLLAALLSLGALGAAWAADEPRNVYSAGGEVRTTAPMTGDFTAAGGRVVVEHAVGGDVTVAGGSVELKAPIGDDLRAGGGDVRLDTTVGGEMFAAGANLELGPGAVVNHGARLFGSNVLVQGRVVGPLEARGERVKIDGEVQGDAQVAAEHIELGPKAKIGGSLRYATAGELVKAEGATVAGALMRDESLFERRERSRSSASASERARRTSWGGGVFTYIAVLACTALLLLLVPAFAGRAAQRVHDAPWASLGAGFATLVAVPVLAVLLFITLLGIPVGIAVLALYPALLLVGFIVSVLFIAHLLPPALHRPLPAGFGPSMGWFALALLLVMLIAKLPFLGALLVAFVALAGLGACVLEVNARRKGPGAPAAPAEQAPLRTPPGEPAFRP